MTQKCTDQHTSQEDNADCHVEVRARLIFIFRLMKVDTVICYDPWAHYEENPDHYVTAQCVEAACWMAAGRWDFPEHLEAGIQPHGVREKYYFARGPQLLNRVVDISSVIDQKVEVNLADVTQGPAGHTGAAERRRLAQQGLRLPLLGNDDDTANRQYIKEIVLRDDHLHDLRVSPEIEDLLGQLDAYELPQHTRRRLLQLYLCAFVK